MSIPPVLWRSSWDEPYWAACDIQAVDFASYLFGLAAHPDLLGTDFFETYNDFDFPDSSDQVFAPELFLQEVLGGKTINVNLSEYVRDLDTPDRLLSWDFDPLSPDVAYSFDSLSSVLTLTFVDTTQVLREVQVRVVDPSGLRDSATLSINFNALGIAPLQRHVPTFQLYPNPFSDELRFTCSLPRPAKVSLCMMDLTGREIGKMETYCPAGTSRIAWESPWFPSTAQSSGAYVVRIQMGAYTTWEKVWKR